MPTRLALAAAGGVLLIAQPAFAHHPSAISGAGGAGPLNTISATTLDKGRTLPNRRKFLIAAITQVSAT